MLGITQMNLEHKWYGVFTQYMYGKEIEYSGNGGKSWGVVESPLWFTGENDMYRVKNKWQKESEAYARGEKIEWRSCVVEWSDWKTCEFPLWYEIDNIEYRVKPAMKYQAEFDAMKDGKTVQFYGFTREWIDYHPSGREEWLSDAYTWRIKPEDPYEEVKRAYAEGKTIQIFGMLNRWFDWKYEEPPMFNLPTKYYRIKPEDPYAELKEAFAKGKRIEVFSNIGKTWYNLGKDARWALPVSRYRIVEDIANTADPYAELKAAYQRSETIEHRVDTNWFKHNKKDGGHFEWSSDVNNYRIMPDPLKDYKDAFHDGKSVQWKRSGGTFWHDVMPGCPWSVDGIEYRIVLPWQEERDAFARGERIECRYNNKMMHYYGENQWEYIENPSWVDYCEYRIAPKLKEVRRYVTLRTDVVSNGLVYDIDIYQRPLQANIEYIFDEDNNLVDVKFIGKKQ